MTVTFKQVRADVFFPVVDGRGLQIPISPEQKTEIERTIAFQPQTWSGNGNPCKQASCAGRNIICHATCPAYLEFRKAQNEANEKRRQERATADVTMKTLTEKSKLARTLKRNAKITKTL